MWFQTSPTIASLVLGTLLQTIYLYDGSLPLNHVAHLSTLAIIISRHCCQEAASTFQYIGRRRKASPIRCCHLICAPGGLSLNCSPTKLIGRLVSSQSEKGPPRICAAPYFCTHPRAATHAPPAATAQCYFPLCPASEQNCLL